MPGSQKRTRNFKGFFFSHKLFQPLSSTYKIVVKDEAVEQNAYKETQAMEREVWG